MPDSLIGKTLGQYQIVELAGRGGMATVYKANQPSLRRYVALKVLPDYLAADEEFVVRFRQEALAAAALRHPNILVIHDVGQEGNAHYMAMEYLEGQTLFDFESQVNLRRGDQPNGALTQSTAQAHSGLASARLDYGFSTSANDFVVFINQVPLSGQPNAIGAWVAQRGDGSGHFLNVWIKDASEQVWQVPLGQVGSPGWHQMVGYIAPGQPWPWTHISGPDNGRVDYPVSFYALVLDDYPDTFIGSGTIYIDDISVWRADSIPTPVSHAPAASATPGAAVTGGPTPTVANEPRGVILINPLNGAFFKSSVITFRWSGGALQPGETFLVEIIPALAEKKGTCLTESDYGNSGHQFSPPLTDHQWTTDIAAPAGNKSKPCAGRIEWRVHVRDANGNIIQNTPRSYFEWNPL